VQNAFTNISSSERYRVSGLGLKWCIYGQVHRRASMMVGKGVFVTTAAQSIQIH
jgi:hypothetical protein